MDAMLAHASAAPPAAPAPAAPAPAASPPAYAPSAAPVAGYSTVRSCGRLVRPVGARAHVCVRVRVCMRGVGVGVYPPPKCMSHMFGPTKRNSRGGDEHTHFECPT